MPDAPADAPPDDPAAEGGSASAEEVDAHVRRADPDRWLAARLVADPGDRANLMALYALNDELARIAPQVSQPMLGEVRFAWWSEALEAAANGAPRGHPTLQAVAPALKSGALSPAVLGEIVEARHLDLEPEPFPDEAALLAYIDATAGALMRAAIVLLDPGAPPQTVLSAGRAWGWTTLMRSGSAWAERGRRWAPRDWGDVPPDTLAERARTRAVDALKAAVKELRPLPVASFPAVAYVRFARDHLRGREPGELKRRAELLLASTLGKV